MGLFGNFLKPEYIGWLWSGLLTTLEISALVIPVATLLGFLVAILRSSKWWAVRSGASAFVATFRNSPLLVQLFFWYFGVPMLLPEAWREWLNATHILGLPWGASFEWPSYEFISGATGLALYSTAYVSEEVRAGLKGVAASQRQAAEALGMRTAQVFRYVLLPQAVRIALPPLMGQYMNIVKNSSLTMAIGVMEISYAARQVETVSFRTFQAYAVATLFYALTIACIEALTQVARLRFPPLGGRR